MPGISEHGSAASTAQEFRKGGLAAGNSIEVDNELPTNRSTRVTALTSLLALLAAASPFKNSGSQIEFFPSRGLSAKECFGAGSNPPEALEPGG